MLACLLDKHWQTLSWVTCLISWVYHLTYWIHHVIWMSIHLVKMDGKQVCMCRLFKCPKPPLWSLVSMFSWSAGGYWFKPQPGQTKDFKIGIWLSLQFSRNIVVQIVKKTYYCNGYIQAFVKIYCYVLIWNETDIS